MEKNYEHQSSFTNQMEFPNFIIKTCHLHVPFSPVWEFGVQLQYNALQGLNIIYREERKSNNFCHHFVRGDASSSEETLSLQAPVKTSK